MKTTVISYSFTGNNDALAKSIATELGAEHIKVIESKRRTMFSILLDIIFNRTPRVNAIAQEVWNNDLVILMGPIWMGQPATPLREYFKHIKTGKCQYAYVTISGGADGDNPKTRDELIKRIGKVPVQIIDLSIAGLLPPEPKPTRNDTMAYRLTDKDVRNLTDMAIKSLKEKMTVS